MPRKCNINRRGRVGRLATGIALTLFSIISMYTNTAVNILDVLLLGGGLFSLAEAVFGWCVLVASLEKVKTGITKNRIIREVLGSTA